jgi:type II secretory pathway pseudopilin PulG
MPDLRKRVFRGRARASSLAEVLIAVTLVGFVWATVVALMVTSARVTKKVRAYAHAENSDVTALDQVRYALSMGSAGALKVTVLDSGHRILFRDPNKGSGVISAFRFNVGTLQYDDDINSGSSWVTKARWLNDLTFQILPGSAIVEVSATTNAAVGYGQTRPMTNRIRVYLRN